MIKKTILSAIFLLLYNISVQGHKEWVHFYITKESYTFLENYLGCELPQIKDYIGFGQTLDNIKDVCNDASSWVTSYPIGVGSWGEDVTDPIWGYFEFKGWTPSVTHFWLADNRDDAGDLQMKLLQKIEELTLYSIEDDKRIEELKKDVGEKNKKLGELENGFKKLEEKIFKLEK